MSNALAWIRKSKGDDDAIGLQQQRQQVAARADELADDVTTLDLGIQTGFSTLSRTDGDMLDDHPEVQTTIDDLRAGEYDHLVALDDRRICRDGYLEVIKHACTAGDCTIEYVRDIATDDLTHDIKRRVDRDTKEAEIEKSRAAVRERQARGYDHGRPKFGMEYDADGHYQVPGEDFSRVVAILEARAEGATFETIAESVGVATSTAHKVVDREAWYRDRAGERLADVEPVRTEEIET